jgi:2-dehydro-3-deoxyphosphogluconate aldolase / (4S)-4-hydroxy-2-oxoglutarate aldolase
MPTEKAASVKCLGVRTMGPCVDSPPQRENSFPLRKGSAYLGSVRRRAMVSPFETIATLGVVPVIAIDEARHALPLADALLEAGLNVVEITFRTEAAVDVLSVLNDRRPELVIGAGTVLDKASLVGAIAAGARFALAPGFDAEIVDAAALSGLPFAPGIMTPSDLSAAARRGVRLAKFFPAGVAGGPVALDGIAAPFLHLGIRFLPTGGVSLETMAHWLALPHVAAVGGTWIARAADIREERFGEIETKARAALARAKALREQLP